MITFAQGGSKDISESTGVCLCLSDVNFIARQ